MTKIDNQKSTSIELLQRAGKGPTEIAQLLELNVNTVKQHIRRKKLVEDLPPQVVLRNNYFSGRIPLRIHRYIQENPRATLEQIKAGAELDCSISHLCRHLKSIGLNRTKAKRSIVISDVNTLK